MMFGEVKKEFFFKNVKGRGYADTGKGVITEFYTPIVPKGYDFLREIGSLAAGRQFSPVMKVDESTMDNDDTEDVFSMKDMIERALSTRDKDENIMGMVTFPCNKVGLQRFQVDDLKELYFVDRPDSRMSVARFNHIIREADARGEDQHDRHSGLLPDG